MCLASSLFEECLTPPERHQIQQTTVNSWGVKEAKETLQVIFYKRLVKELDVLQEQVAVVTVGNCNPPHHSFDIVSVHADSNT